MSVLDEIKAADVLVVGTGFFGAVVAERMANVSGKKVLILDKRNHIGGNCFSETDAATGINVHHYGTHIFHTSDANVWQYLNKFTQFNSYQHRVLTTARNRVFSMPINLATINVFYDLNLGPAAAREFLAQEISKYAIVNPDNLEDKAISLIGKPLYEAFIKGYSEKQWETDLRKVPASVITRLPVRFNFNDRYFSDTYEGIPVDGYTPIFERMLDNDRITTRLGVDYFDIRAEIPQDKLTIYTGPIDRFFDYRFGHLGWRTLRLESAVLPVDDHQGTSVMNFADREVPYTRIHEFMHLHPEKSAQKRGAFIMKEYSKFAAKDEEPYYPINTDADRAVFAQYREQADAHPSVIFGGRLARYLYLDMHQVIGAALQCFERKISPRF